jgi:hypothetical protein
MKRHILYSLYIAVLLALLYFDKVLTFVMNIICKLTHPIQCSGIVLCAIGTVVVIAIEILRRKYPIVHKWETKFEQFICEDENRCMRWLCSMVSFYSNGRIEWNYRHHEAIIGEYTNSGDHLYERIKQKFPNHIDIVDELIHFQNYGSLKDLTLTNSKYIQMAKDMQAT